MTSTTNDEQVFGACDRFFAIPELVDIFLQQASTQVLINCQRVCSTWKDLIDRSQALKEALFLSPAENGSTDIRINPMLFSHFSPILAPSKDALSDLMNEGWTTHDDVSSNAYAASQLYSLPWALDSRKAFTRPEASWRKMLVSQPPISRLDWWHEWSFDDPHDVYDSMSGWGHQDLNGSNLTIGMLWDLVEARLVRGCQVSVMYFPRGQDIPTVMGRTVDPVADGTAKPSEREWAGGRNSSQRGWTAEMPRVKLQTHQYWYSVPNQHNFYANFRQWVLMPDPLEEHLGDGFNLLRQDCAAENENGPRWSKSEGFEWAELDGESSGHY